MAEHPFMPVRTSFHRLSRGGNTRRIVVLHGASRCTMEHHDATGVTTPRQTVKASPHRHKWMLSHGAHAGYKPTHSSVIEVRPANHMNPVGGYHAVAPQFRSRDENVAVA